MKIAPIKDHLFAGAGAKKGIKWRLNTPMWIDCQILITFKKA